MAAGLKVQRQFDLLKYIYIAIGAGLKVQRQFDLLKYIYIVLHAGRLARGSNFCYRSTASKLALCTSAAGSYYSTLARHEPLNHVHSARLSGCSPGNSTSELCRFLPMF